MNEPLPGASHEQIGTFIRLVRNHRVILDSDLSKPYEVPTKRLNEQFRRNLDRFPEDFAFELTQDEWTALRSQIATLKAGRGSHRKYLPIAFTEFGALMAANVLNSPRAVALSVYVIRAFVKMREDLATNAARLKRLAEIDKTLLLRPHTGNDDRGNPIALTFSDDIPRLKPEQRRRRQHVAVVTVNLLKALSDRASEVKRIRRSQEQCFRSRCNPPASEMHRVRFHGEPMPDTIGLVLLKPSKRGGGFLSRDQAFPRVSFHRRPEFHAAMQTAAHPLRGLSQAEQGRCPFRSGNT